MQWITQEFLVQAPGSPGGLDVLKVEVERSGRHPLALLTHGTSNNPVERAQMTPWSMLPQARWFAQRGFVVLVVVRKGYGRSSGAQDAVRGNCRSSDYSDAGEQSAMDLKAVADFAGSLPEVDTGTIVSAGVSTGGFAQVALTANPPRGL